MNLGDERRRMVAVARRLDQRGIFGSTDGNLSVRLADGSFLVSPSGSCKGWLEPGDLVVVGSDGSSHGGMASSELLMHLAIYEERPDVGAIVHAHPVEATARAVAGLPVDRPILSEAILTIGTAAVVDWAIPGSAGIAEKAAGAAVSHDVMLLRFHGAVALGSTIEEACFRMETLEHVCLVERLSRELGGGEQIPAADVLKLEERRQRMRRVPR